MDAMDERPIVVALGSLPPHVDGPVMGYVKVRIKVRADGPWLARVRWWGAMAMHEKGDLLREGQTLAFPVHVSRDRFARYLADMGPLRLDVVDKATHQVVGRAEVPLSLAEMETPGLEKEAPIVRKSTFQVRGVLQLSATLLWGENDTPIPIASAVTVRRNRDLVLPTRLVPTHNSSSRTPSTDNSDTYEHVYEKDKYDHQPARREPSPVTSRLDALVKKGEALKKAMQQAINAPIETNLATQHDVATVLATAKSLGPDDAPSYSWRTLVDQYTKDDSCFFKHWPRHAAQRLGHHPYLPLQEHPSP
ncbi:hypothetical protein SPRG_19009 [Saprolegnia parasitica CBS 223.65]|uniref:C2CD3 N-terminal C2 domain-containing protein n=1 Tax=Saprolegnia parasitica (strain CBS 223.65) TaxID=695850 RepID=A0A067CTX1_SAPPC|nr:hypothetical protein SPRG_19009 [Saprolegnia parasitica CBS 223.65]KDO34154.1 hypothetical protein SPRG_19009 [Saprolegnia parasitica CBS 223.65]|eukprot:XP_012195208.1 hypothetical protein SPRG_19009 [Saprolegnia parasitica CBS 223.65]